jgi:hypothetical protein
VASREWIKVFLGSPDDLSVERKKFPHIIDGVNKTVAHSKNMHLEAVLWEDALRGAGEAQALIDEELKECDIVVLNLWKKWGSPTKKYTSGFEEEYELSNKLNAAHGRPEMFMYFRGSEADMKGEPTGQVESVLNFRKKIMNEKKHFYQAYNSPREWEQYLREHICRWLNRYADSFIEAKKSGKPFVKIHGEDMSLDEESTKPNDFQQWSILTTPDSIPNTIKEIYNPGNRGCSVIKIAVANDGSCLWAIVRNGSRNGITMGGAQTMLLQSTNMGHSWHDTAYKSLVDKQSAIRDGTHVWDIALAPDDPQFIAAVCADISKGPLFQEVWLSTDRGKTWTNTQWPPQGMIQGQDLIGAIDISSSHEKRTIMVGTRDGSGLGYNNIQINRLHSAMGWFSSGDSKPGNNATKIAGDILATKFSPSFATDSGIAVIYCEGTPNRAGTWLATGQYDITKNLLIWQKRSEHLELRNKNGKPGDSPRIDEVTTAQIELPPDYYYLDKKFRRLYICVDAVDSTEDRSPNRGIYRIIGNNLETLMDTTKVEIIGDTKRARRIASIAYAPGKLLAGEVLGFSDLATVHTWFMDVSDTTKICCWYPALKPTSGAALHKKFYPQELNYSYGNARVAWSPDATLAFVATGAASLGCYSSPIIDQQNAIIPRIAWPAGYVNVVPCDESSIAISRNNGETWNQLSLINTVIAKLTDFACGTDNTTLYISTSNAYTGYLYVHSIWRTTINPNVVAPLPAVPPSGTLWERVFHYRDTINNAPNGDSSIIRTIWSCTDKKDGEIVGWALPNTKAMYWTPDFGDYWDPIKATSNIVDFSFESSTTIYALYTDGYVQRIPYDGTKWRTHLPLINSLTGKGHCITSTWNSVFVGAAQDSSTCALSCSLDGGNTWQAVPRNASIMGNVQIAIDQDFRNNRYIYVVDDSCNSKCYRLKIDSVVDWAKCDIKCPEHNKFSGLIMAFTGRPQPALYLDYTHIVNDNEIKRGILRTLSPRTNINHQIPWDHFDNPLPAHDAKYDNTYEPFSLKAAGCCTLDTSTSLYTIDRGFYASNHNVAFHLFNLTRVGERGMLWRFVDRDGKNYKCSIK